MLDTGFDPTVHIGGQLDYIGGFPRRRARYLRRGGRVQRELPPVPPDHAAITNIEEDHLDFYKDIDDIAHAFARFCALRRKRRVHRHQRPARARCSGGRPAAPSAMAWGRITSGGR
ncbi:MAG: Mur ligase family protein [Christensenellales bacterium]